MKTHTVEMWRTFSGQVTAHSTHNVTSMPGLVRVARGATQGQGHGITLAITKACAIDLGIEARGGSLWAGACEIAFGEIA